MKRLLILAALVLAFAGSAAAQSVVGTYRYKAPAGKVEGLNLGKMGNAMFSTMFRSQLKSEMDHQMDSLGVNKKSCMLSLKADGSFTMPTASGFVIGTYKYDAGSSRLTLTANNGHSATGSAELDGSELTLMYSMQEYCDFMCLVSLAEYKGNIPDEVMEEIKTAQEEMAKEIKELEEGMSKMGDEMKKDPEISEEQAARLAEMFGNMKLYMGVVFKR